MIESPRGLSVIKQELDELRLAIGDIRSAMELQSESFALELALQGLTYREQELIDELQESLAVQRFSIVELILNKGDDLRTSISMLRLGRLLGAFQNLVTANADAMRPAQTSGRLSESVKRITSLNVEAFATGSFRVLITGPQELMDPVVIHSLNRLDEILGAGTNAEELRKIKGYLTPRVVHSLKGFLSTCLDGETETRVSWYMQNRQRKEHVITSKSAQTILDTIGKLGVTTNSDVVITGRIKALDIINNRFTLITSGKPSRRIHWGFLS